MCEKNKRETYKQNKFTHTKKSVKTFIKQVPSTLYWTLVETEEKLDKKRGRESPVKRDDGARN